MSGSRKPTALPLFPLNTVVFPGGKLPLKIFEQRYLDMIKQAIADDTPFGLCGIKEGNETGDPAVPYDIGTYARVTDWDMPQTGILHIETCAMERFVIRSVHAEPNGLLIGTVEDVSVEPAAPVPNELELSVEILRHIVNEYGDEHFPTPLEFDNATWVGFRLSEVLPLTLSIKQHLLEMNDSITRLRILTEFLKKQIN
ncbi:MAG: LON peptidase substrate-binding domain-containing protein [Thiobacillus sp.]|nr:LON peptidase substrate-binding domain-containing protein [Thiobacillus sp.]